MADSVGILEPEFNLPCGLSWVNSNNMVLDGQSPFETEVVDLQPGGQMVTLSYNLPFSS